MTIDLNIQEIELAKVTEARAYQVDDVIVVQVSGTATTSCHVITIERTPVHEKDVPEFLVRQWLNPAIRCKGGAASFDTAAGFRTTGSPSKIVIHHSGEGAAIVVDVKPITTNDAERRILPSPDGDTAPRTATGRSAKWDLGEAMHDAISQLPGDLAHAGIPDWLNTYTVTEIQAQVGGIAGFNHLVVTVEGR